MGHHLVGRVHLFSIVLMFSIPITSSTSSKKEPKCSVDHSHCSWPVLYMLLFHSYLNLPKGNNRVFVVFNGIISWWITTSYRSYIYIYHCISITLGDLRSPGLLAVGWSSKQVCYHCSVPRVKCVQSWIMLSLCRDYYTWYFSIAMLVYHRNIESETSPNYWGYNLQQIFQGDVKQIPNSRDINPNPCPSTTIYHRHHHLPVVFSGV